MFTLDAFHQLCANGNLAAIKLHDDIPALYENLENKEKYVNGLFWAVVFNQFEVAKYLLEEKIFDPHELICGEIHILHVLATIGGRENELLNPIIPYALLFNVYLENIEYVPEIIDENGILCLNRYDKKKVLEFTSYLIETYGVNVSVKTNKKWLTLEEDSQGAQWLNYYQTIIRDLSKDLNIACNLCRFTPFHLSCLFGYADMTRLLVESGCDILCMGCKNVCPKCPYAMRSFLKDFNSFDDLLVTYFRIFYTSTDIKTMNSRTIESEASNQWDYLFNELFWVLVDERLSVDAYSLEYLVLDKIARCIIRGIYVKDISDLPRSITENIKQFIDFKYYKIPKRQLSNLPQYRYRYGRARYY